MAKHKVGENMQFFYNETFSFDLLIKELSDRFNYQKVWFIGFDEGFKQKMENRKDILFFPEFFDTITTEIETEIACVVCNNEKNFKLCNKICNDKSLNLILFVDTYFNIFNFCLGGDAKLLGVVMDKEKLEKSSKMFVLNFLFNLSEMVFYTTESKINNIYFNKALSEKIKKINEKIENFINLMQKNTIFYNFNEVMDYYFEFVDMLFNENQNIQNFISSTLNIANFDNFVLCQILLNVYLCFSENINPNLVDYPSLSIENYKSVESFITFNKEFEIKKFWFIYNRFNFSVQNLIGESLSIIQKIKNLCNVICVDEMFNLTVNTKILEIKNKLCNIVMQYPNESFLKVVCNYGLLNFEKNIEKSA